ncbi:N-6 DNA methylase, partial [Comamonas jiangduensis]|uniref:N-6 DNA methylase n=1 Tax=Comamonas jiangduensis TaxID=1194168 RepID=UPI003BF83471
AFFSLLDTYRASGHASNSIAFALTWLAGARMVITGNVPGVQSVEELGNEAGWRALEAADLPLYGLHRVLPNDKEFLSRGKGIVTKLVHELGTQPWEVLPTLTAAAKSSRDVEAMVSLSAAELMLDMLGEPEQDLWIPFDRWGMLTMLAVRRGWHVNAAPMLGNMESTLPLLMAIEFGKPQHPLVEAAIERNRNGRPVTQAANVLACPPFGVKMQESSLAQWDSGPEDQERFARSETWAVRELVNRCKKKAVFLLPTSILFKLGQEQRLREYLLHRGKKNNVLHSVVGLPIGAFLAAQLPTAVMVLTPEQDHKTSLLVDLGISRRALTNIDELIHNKRPVALGLEDDPELACKVTREKILNNEVSFAPSRYLRKSFEVGPNAVPLKNLCEVIKAPVLARDDSGEEFLELGIPELGCWNATGHNLERSEER